MGYPAVTAENVKIDVVDKGWHGDRQLYIDNYGRSWIMGTYGLELFDGNVGANVEAPAPEAAPAEEVAEEEVTVVDEADIEPQDNLVEVIDPAGDEDVVPAELLEDAVADTSDDPSPGFEVGVEDADAPFSEAEEAALALIDAGGDPFADEDAASEAVIPSESDDTPTEAA